MEGASDDGDECLVGARIGSWILKKPIGRGGFGVVWEAEYSCEGGSAAVSRDILKAAVKLLPRGNAATADRISSELACLSELSHPNVMHMLGFYPSLAGIAPASLSGSQALVLELADVGDVTHMCFEQPTRRLPPGAARDIMLQAARGLAHVHSKGIVHCDVKLDNLLISVIDKGSATGNRSRLESVGQEPVAGSPVPIFNPLYHVLKLSDFGLARLGAVNGGDADVLIGDLLSGHARAGSLYYLPPEALQGEAALSRPGTAGVGRLQAGGSLNMRPPPVNSAIYPSRDSWSLGICLFAMLMGFFPFRSRSVLYTAGVLKRNAEAESLSMSASVSAPPSPEIEISSSARSEGPPKIYRGNTVPGSVTIPDFSKLEVVAGQSAPVLCRGASWPASVARGAVGCAERPVISVGLPSPASPNVAVRARDTPSADSRRSSVSSEQNLLSPTKRQGKDSGEAVLSPSKRAPLGFGLSLPPQSPAKKGTGKVTGHSSGWRSPTAIAGLGSSAGASATAWLRMEEKEKMMCMHGQRAGMERSASVESIESVGAPGMDPLLGSSWYDEAESIVPASIVISETHEAIRMGIASAGFQLAIHGVERIAGAEARDLIMALLSHDPEQRLSMVDVLQHPWLVTAMRGISLDLLDPLPVEPSTLSTL